MPPARKPVAALHKGPKKFSRDFPERGELPERRAFGAMRSRQKSRNVSGQKHKSRRRRFFIPEMAVFTRIAEHIQCRPAVPGLHRAFFSSTMNSPDNAISERSIRRHDNIKRL
ncbi:hypothetical protein [Burkholderia sp. BCC1047]|uniref:hypothetical protein n=1 Tax=Burkholderia sp. BCC1047 TaxID=2676299 RepID=UPI00158D9D44|nr:hypothetical protein [Burkholderia sp. BCC1047]